jgi:hypothetical protein
MACENFMEQEKPNMIFFSFQIPFDNFVVLKKQKKRKSREKKKHNLSKTWGGWGWLCF